jgi:hypothetical protein
MGNMLSGPGGTESPRPDGEDGAEQPRSTRARRRRYRAPTVEDCLRSLGQLPGLIALHYVKPAEASAMRGIYQLILQQLERDKQASSAQGKLADADVAELMRTNPEVLEMLTAVLSEEQIAMIMGEIEEKEGEKA